MENFISTALKDVNSKVNEAKSRRPGDLNIDVCIVAVSKTKPKQMIIEAYDHGHRHFGENYVNELVDKAADAEIIHKCPDIKWHFIGHLQGNKVNKLIGVPNLYMIQTIDSKKLADAVNKSWAKAQKPHLLKVMVQVNTSREDSKSGVTDEDAGELTQYIIEKCDNLSLVGFMMIGYAHYDLEKAPNPEFQFLLKFRDEMCIKFDLDPNNMGLSMGMSHDFEHAIEVGSTCIRVGNSIFGSRTYPNPEAEK